MLDTFSMTVVKSTRSALQRQVREAVEIARDRSFLLLNSKEEYNRCLVPSIRMEGPSHPKRQAEVERDMDLGTVRLTREQEEKEEKERQDLVESRSREGEKADLTTCSTTPTKFRQTYGVL